MLVLVTLIFMGPTDCMHACYGAVRVGCTKVVLGSLFPIGVYWVTCVKQQGSVSSQPWRLHCLVCQQFPSSNESIVGTNAGGRVEKAAEKTREAGKEAQKEANKP